MVIANLKDMVDSAVTTNVAVQETLDAKQEVIDKIAEAQDLVDTLDANTETKKLEINSLAENKKLEINNLVNTSVQSIEDKGALELQEFDEHAEHRLIQYDENHTIKLIAYNENDSTKIEQYNDNHVQRLENLNYAYADRIVDLINTKKLLGVIDQFTAQKPTQYANFLDTTDPEYLYYLNGIRIIEGTDYLIVDNKTIKLVLPIEAYDVIIQISPTLLSELLIHKQVLTEPMKGVPNGVASLDSNGQVPAIQLPSYVDDIIEVATHADLPVEGEFNKIYVVVADETQGGDTSTYRWTGTVYAIVSNSLTAEDVKALYESNANTNAYTDAEKLEVSTIQNRLDTKQDVLVDGVNIKTINGKGLVGSGNLLVATGAGGYTANVYLTNEESTTNSAYKQLSYIPEETSSEISVIVNDTAEVLMASYIFDGDVLTDFIPSGEWQFSFSRKVNNTSGQTKLRFVIIKRSALGVETELFSIDGHDINDTTYAHENIIYIQPMYEVLPTDRIGLKVYANTTRTVDTTVSMQVGDGNAAYLVSPLGVRHNQLRARNDANSHPIEAISGLVEALSDLQENIDIITSIEEW